MTFSWFNLRPPKKPATPAERSAVVMVDGDERQVRVVENARTNRLTLRLLPGGVGLRLTVPPGTTDREINGFLDKHKAWAAARLARMPKPLIVEQGATIPFRGQPYEIVGTNKHRGLVTIDDTTDIPQLLVPGGPSHLPRRLVDFLKKQARQDLTEAVDIHARDLGVRVNSITLRDTKSRWGSCSSNGNLSFSWRIIMAPPEILDYLAAHEVAHLREMNHSPQFWALVEDICPNMQVHKSWLRVHGAKLHAVQV